MCVCGGGGGKRGVTVSSHQHSTRRCFCHNSENVPKPEVSRQAGQRLRWCVGGRRTYLIPLNTVTTGILPRQAKRSRAGSLTFFFFRAGRRDWWGGMVVVVAASNLMAFSHSAPKSSSGMPCHLLVWNVYSHNTIPVDWFQMFIHPTQCQ